MRKVFEKYGLFYYADVNTNQNHQNKLYYYLLCMTIYN